MPTLITPSAALGFTVPNSSSFDLSPDTRALEISGISNAANNVDITTIPLNLFSMAYSKYNKTYNQPFSGGLPGINSFLHLQTDDNGWGLYKDPGLVRLASAPFAGSNNPPKSGWTLLNGTVGTLRVKQVNPYPSAMPTPTAGGVLPSAIANLKVWLKADVGITTTNEFGRTEVASWADQSGSGLLAYPSAGYNGRGVPVISNVLNSKPVVQIEPSSLHAILLSNIPSFNISECTTICIHKPNDFGNRFSAGRKLYALGYRIGGSYQGANVGARINHELHYASQKPVIYRDRYVGEIIYFLDQVTPSGPDYTQTPPRFRISTRVNSTSLARTDLYDNGLASGFTYDAVIAPNSNGYVALGTNGYYSYLDFDGNYIYSGQIAEFIHFNRALTDQELSNVTEGLRLKYALY